MPDADFTIETLRRNFGEPSWWALHLDRLTTAGVDCADLAEAVGRVDAAILRLQALHPYQRPDAESVTVQAAALARRGHPAADAVRQIADDMRAGECGT